MAKCIDNISFNCLTKFNKYANRYIKELDIRQCLCTCESSPPRNKVTTDIQLYLCYISIIA